MTDYQPRSPSLEDQYEVWLRLLNDREILSAYEVIVRWHPNLQSAGPLERSRAAAVIEGSSNVRHVLPEDDVDTYELIEGSDVVLGWS